MDHFHYRDGRYHAEEVDLTTLSEQVGTPFYCYSSATLERHYQVFAAPFPAETLICYAVKANSNPAIIRTLANLGAGADVVSEGEIRMALAGGVAPNRIVFSGVGKMVREMAFALEKGIFQFNVESLPELQALSAVASAKGVKAPVALRVNPDVDPETHAKISTGQKETKFGIAMADALALYREANALPGIRVQGVSMHIGSQLTRLAPFERAFHRLRDFVTMLRSENIPIETIDLGGGLGIPYEPSDAVPTPEAYGELVNRIFTGFSGRIMLEPGRLLVGNAGILVTRVLYIKTEQGRRFIILDAGMNDLMRPALYGARHALVPVIQNDAEHVTADIVGPVCETSDIFEEQASLPLPKPGDLLALRSAGAYGASMANSYNSRLLIPEVLVKGTQHAVIRPRPSYEDVLSLTAMPNWQ